MRKLNKKYIFILSIITGFLLIFIGLTPYLLSLDSIKIENIENSPTVFSNNEATVPDCRIVDPNITRKDVPLKFTKLTLTGRNNSTGYYLQKFGLTTSNQENNTYLLYEKVANYQNYQMNYSFTWYAAFAQQTDSTGSMDNVLPYAIPFIITSSTNKLNIAGQYNDQNIFAFAHDDISFNFGSTFNIYVMGLYESRYMTPANNSEITINYQINNLTYGYIAFGIVFAEAFDYSTYEGSSPYNYVTDYGMTSYATTEFMVQNGVYGYAAFFDSYIKLYIEDNSTTTSIAYNNGYENGYNTGKTDGYSEGYNAGYATGNEAGKITANSNAFNFTWLTTLFEGLNTIFNVEIFPNFKLWYLIGIPLIISLVVAVFKILR